MAADRDTILARRALFITSALSGMVTAPSATAQQDAPCVPSPPPTADELAMARKLYQQAIDRSQAGQLEEALVELERVHSIAANPKVLVAIARIALQAEDWARAHNAARRALECDSELGTAREHAVAIEERTRALVARVRIRTRPDGAEIQIDDAVAGTTPIAEPIAVNPGRHVVLARWPGSGETASTTLELAANDEETVLIEQPPNDDCVREPCVCLQPLPCLQPPLVERRPRFGAGIGYTAWLDVVDDDRTNHGHGARVRGFYELPFAKQLDLQLGLGVTPTRTKDGTLVPIGAELAIAIKADPIVVMPTLSGGYLWSNDERTPSSVFYAQELAIGVELSEQVVVGAFAGALRSMQRDEIGRDSFRIGWITTGAFFSYAFGPACDELGFVRPCRGEDY